MPEADAGRASLPTLAAQTVHRDAGVARPGHQDVHTRVREQDIWPHPVKQGLGA